MTESENILLKDFGHNIDRLVSLVERLQRENRQLLQDKEALLSEVSQLTSDNEVLKGKCESLKLARSLAGNTKESSDAKQKLTKIVREIDRCLSLLNR